MAPSSADVAASRALVDELIAETKLYSSSSAVKELLEFTARLRHMAPFNAMLLHIQKPGLSYAMTAHDWRTRFGRRPKAHARPLIVLRNFGPVDFVYDVQDTEGEPLPDTAFAFPTAGALPTEVILDAERALRRSALLIEWLDKGDLQAGYTRKISNHGDSAQLEAFEIGLNRNHAPPVQFVTLAHELAHIYLGHCGSDAKRKVAWRRPSHDLREVEAEVVAYLVAKRSGLSPRSESYLDSYQGAFENLDLHRIMKCTNRIESLLGLPLDFGNGPR